MPQDSTLVAFFKFILQSVAMACSGSPVGYVITLYSDVADSNSLFRAIVSGKYVLKLILNPGCVVVELNVRNTCVVQIKAQIVIKLFTAVTYSHFVNSAFGIQPLPPLVLANRKHLTVFYIKYFFYLFQQ